MDKQCGPTVGAMGQTREANNEGPTVLGCGPYMRCCLRQTPTQERAMQLDRVTTGGQSANGCAKQKTAFIL